MTKFIRFLSVFILSLIAFALNAKAGDTEAHGGHIVHCPGKSPELLDFYEARNEYHFQPRAYLTYGEMAAPARFEYYAPAIAGIKMRAAVILGRRHPFLNLFPENLETARIEGAASLNEIKRTKDWGQIFPPLPSGCALHQIAAWRNDSRVTKIKVFVPEWDDLSLDDQTGLLLHEMLHDWFGRNTTTLATRQAVVFLVAPGPFRTRNADLFRRLIETHRPIAGYR